MARRLIGVGVVGAAPAAATGVADWRDTDGAEQRIGAVHALVNEAAVLSFAASWFVRRRGNQLAGRWLSGFGTTAVAAAGYLGGHLAYSRGVGVNTTSFQSGPEDWTAVCAVVDLPDGEVSQAHFGNVALAVVTEPLSVLEDRCTHRGGPLSDGAVDGDCIVCPWHGSRFSTRDGSVRRGPACVPQPVYQSRLRNGEVEVRREEFGELRRRPVGARIVETSTDSPTDIWMFDGRASGYQVIMTNDNASISDDDITTGPTEDDDNLDAPSEHSKDTGDEPTESDENVDAPGEHSGDTGDES